MGFNKKKNFLTKEILFNKLGQILIRKRFLFRATMQFFRFNAKGL